MQDARDGLLKELDMHTHKGDEQAAKDAIAPRQHQGVVIHEGDIYELTDEKGKIFRLRVIRIHTRNRIMMKLI